EGFRGFEERPRDTLMFGWFRKKEPKVPEKYRDWQYLGWTEIRYYKDGDPDTITSRHTIHFYAKEPELKTRKVEYHEQKNTYYDPVKLHTYYQQQVIPWLNGANIYSAIYNPSVIFEKITKDMNGYERIDGVWVKPAPRVERDGNIVSFPITDKK